MAKYRKKPVVVEAFQWFPDRPHPDVKITAPDRGSLEPRGIVQTAGGNAIVYAGDWVIAELDGRGYYPCRPKIFAATYEAVGGRPVKSLSAILTAYGSDKCRFHHDGQGHAYGPVYDDVIGPRRDRLTAVLEVGVLGGSSLRAWREWVPPVCRVVGIDNNLTCGAIPGVDLYQADSTNANAVRAVLGDSVFDLIVDDGGHALHEQAATWDALIRHLRPSGFFVVEDLQSAEAREYFARLGYVIYDYSAQTGKWDDAVAVYTKVP